MEGAILRKFRGERKQRDVACDICVAPSTLSKYESGKLRIPPDVAVRVAVVTGRSDALEAYCQGCPVRQFMARRQQLQVFKGGKAA